MHAAIIYESLTGNTRKAARLIAAGLEEAGVVTSAMPITAIDYQALAEADLVVVGSWTDGVFVFGQRPGRAGRLRRLPYITGKRCVVFCTYALDAGHTLDKLVAIMADRGGEVLGGMAIRRDNLVAGSQDFVGRVLDVVNA